MRQWFNNLEEKPQKGHFGRIFSLSRSFYNLYDNSLEKDFVSKNSDCHFISAHFFQLQQERSIYVKRLS